MIFYKIDFGPLGKKDVSESLDVAEDYLAVIVRYGQISEGYQCVFWQGRLIAYVQAMGLEADRPKSHSKRGKEYLRKLSTFFGRKPLWKINEDIESITKITWKNAPFLYLQADMFDIGTPLCRGDNGYEIPLYRVPLSDDAREYTCLWQKKYRVYDDIWIGSSELEMQAYRVLADPESGLSKMGREHCYLIEQATGVPTYYYLMRYFGRQEPIEKKRRCPVCGNTWYQPQFEQTAKEDRYFWYFDFQCEPCRLVSHLACGEINARYAKIGEPCNKSKT